MGATAGPVTVRILNTGSAPVDLDKPVLADTVHYELATPLPDAKVTLIKGASYSFTLKFNPGMTAGQLPTQVTVTSTHPLKLAVMKTVSLTNKGKKPLTVSRSRVIAPMGEFTAALPADNTVVMPGASLAIAVTPTVAGTGDHSAAERGAVRAAGDRRAVPGQADHAHQ
jgi:archaellum component FlaF (FlaF/FlaG flagellin family)